MLPLCWDSCLRYAIISDIHSNLEALEAVKHEIDRLGADVILCGGDIVGYNADPGSCLDIVREISHGVVAGNHDWGVVARLDIDAFTPNARMAIQWAEERLSAADCEWIEALPLIWSENGVTLVHGSLEDPEAFNYYFPFDDPVIPLELQETPACFSGHTHVPVAFYRGEPPPVADASMLPVEPGGRILVNVGSVGQPRDGDPRASFAIYDQEKGVIEMHRVEYDIQKTAEKIAAAGLPSYLAERLFVGR
jgi:diadenosine tetraphosphatase ApaH/serine/threonine PP2A family protein phosphatase